MSELMVPNTENVTTFATAVLEPNVKRGAQFLDETEPNWYRIINVGTLEMSHTTSCVVGQTFGWDAGINQLERWLDEPVWSEDGEWLGVDSSDLVIEHGFDIDQDAVTEPFTSFLLMDGTRVVRQDGSTQARGVMDVAWEVLEVLWVNEIKARYESDDRPDVLGHSR